MDAVDRKPRSGRWLVVAMLVIGLTLALVALRYRKLTPRPQFPSPAAATQQP